jgi:hypothetical protein
MKNLTQDELLILVRSMDRYIMEEFADEDVYAIELYQKKEYVKLKKHLNRFVECNKLIKKINDKLSS